MALGGVGQRDLYGAGGWDRARGVATIDVFGSPARRFSAGPRGYSRPDERIYDDVCQALARDREIDSSEIEVVVVGGEVTLGGSVPVRWMKLRAEAVTDTVPGVVDIQNRLRIV